MSRLSHSSLKTIAARIDSGLSPFRWIDVYAAQFLVDELDEQNEWVIRLMVLTSYATSQGETHLDLNELSRWEYLGLSLESIGTEELVSLLNNASSSVSNDPSVSTQQITPLVIHDNKLYLRHFWHYQQCLEAWLSRNARVIDISEPQVKVLSRQFKLLFSPKRSGAETSYNAELDWQAVAAAQALTQQFTMVTGGPGTGKTTTAARLLFLLINQYVLRAEAKSVAPVLPNIALLAPTGKAAVKLASAIRMHMLTLEGLGTDACSPLSTENVLSCLPETGMTIHRFLHQAAKTSEVWRVTEAGGQRQIDSESILLGGAGRSFVEIDILIVDESSMIDLSLMAQLVNVLPDYCRVVLLGDHFQLPAVEPGQVFSDWVRRYLNRPQSRNVVDVIGLLLGRELASDELPGKAGAAINPLCQLRKTYRFDGDLKAVADCIKTASASDFRALFKEWQQQENHAHAVRWMNFQTVANHKASYAACIQSAIAAYHDYFSCVEKGGSLDELVEAFECFQLLCSTYEGPLGVHYLNQQIESRFGFYATATKSPLYHGKAILVTQNHPALGIYNGDIGYVLMNPKGSLDVHFPFSSEQAAKNAQGDTSLVVSPARIQAWQPAYAMTVHKSQGSEYESVSVLVADYAKELLSRALLYTAVTRSKKRCDIWANEDSIDIALSRLG